MVFLRYWEGGPHLRIRFFRPNPQLEKEIRAQAKSFITNHPPRQRLTREQYYQNHKFDGKPVDVSQLPWYDNGSILQMPYYPEYERYGGKHAMPVSEDLFHASSELAVELIQTTRQDYSQRVSKAMDVMVLTALALCVEPEELSVFFARYAHFWRGHVEQAEAAEERFRTSFASQRERLVNRLRLLIQLVDSEEEYPLYRSWLNRLHSACQAYQRLGEEGEMVSPLNPNGETKPSMKQAISAIAFSQIHMTNNRLGVIPPYEHYLGTMIHLTAEACFHASA